MRAHGRLIRPRAVLAGLFCSVNWWMTKESSCAGPQSHALGPRPWRPREAREPAATGEGCTDELVRMVDGGDVPRARQVVRQGGKGAARHGEARRVWSVRCRVCVPTSYGLAGRGSSMERQGQGERGQCGDCSTTASIHRSVIQAQRPSEHIDPLNTSIHGAVGSAHPGSHEQPHRPCTKGHGTGSATPPRSNRVLTEKVFPRPLSPPPTSGRIRTRVPPYQPSISVRLQQNSALAHG